jgi:hypothetical protein
MYSRHYGNENSRGILVVHGTSRDFNPSLPQEEIDKALERDAAAASAEYLAQFRTDVECFVTREVVQNCVTLGIHERPPVRANSYVAFVDPSGGSSVSMTLAIAHKEGETEILDAVRERRAPFSPEAAVEEFASLIKTYRCAKVNGDRYAAEWPREQFQKRGIFYEPAREA